MKTERFDDEFRRKLLGLPADTDPGEVERVYTHVQTHRPAHPGVSWGKIRLLGGMGLLLTASLIYNFIQSYRNTHLQVSLDSLTQKMRLAQHQITHDTVYVTRLSPKKTTIDESQSEEIKQFTGDESTGDQLITSSKRNPELTEVASEPVHRINRMTDKATLLPTLENRRGKTRAPADSTNVVARHVHETATAVENFAPVARKEATKGWRIARSKRATDPLTRKTVETTAGRTSAYRPERTGETSPTPLTPSLERTETNSVAGMSGNRQLKSSKLSKQRQNKPLTPDGSTSPIESVTERNRQPIGQLASRPLDKVRPFAKTLSAYRVAFLSNLSTTARRNYQRWHLSLPSLSVPNAQYRLGGGLTGGAEDQISGALLGEVAFNSHWSLQAGVRVLYSQGFHYRNERDFDDHQDDDFRQLYTPQLPITSDIEDINLTSVIAQVPIQVAYHYPLSKQWRLRLGIGTDLDLWGRSLVSYKYQGTGRSPERGLIAVEPSIHLFNNVTLTPSVEWYQKRWLFRAGPFISPQLRSVSYKPDDLSWGANVQVLYQLGK